MKYYIGIDLGGTNIVAGVVNEAYEILAKASVKTNLPRPEQEIAADMAKVAKEAAEKAGLTMDQIEWVGIGTPGIANSETGIIEYSNNLGFVNTPMVKYIEDALGKKAFIENDANAAAYDWISLELSEDDCQLPPVSDAEDIELQEGDIIRNISVNIRFYEGWDE